MTFFQLLLIAVVQGITEFLPISSSGHLILIPYLTDFPDQGPMIDVAVHVFAPDPADRFVLVDGERYGEGDALARGVQLEEIRPRGIVVGFRTYRIRIE